MTDPTSNVSDTLAELIGKYRSSRHPFFARLANYPSQKLRDGMLLDDLYARYQAAMHATRVMLYFIPHLDNVDLRIVKLRILTDEDGAADGDTHQFQLRRTWEFMLGRPPRITDAEFGELDELKGKLDTATASFVELTKEIYPLSLGPWLIIEGLAHDWIGALLQGLTPHFPGIEATDYFRENYTNCLEERHASESLDVTVKVLHKRPDLLEETVNGAQRMGEGLDAFWSGLENLLSQTDTSQRA